MKKYDRDSYSVLRVYRGLEKCAVVGRGCGTQPEVIDTQKS